MEFLPGDILACHGTDWKSRVIRCATSSLVAPAGLRLGPSHVAIICHWRQQILWTESTTLCRTPCLIRGECVEGVQAHTPDDRIHDYVQNGGRVDVFRLVQFHRLTLEESRLLTRLIIDEFITPAIDYDLGGALLSGTRVFQLSRFYPGTNLNELFCSELVAAIAMRLNRMNHTNPSRFNPARLLRTLFRTGKYERVAILDQRGRHLLSSEGGST